MRRCSHRQRPSGAVRQCPHATPAGTDPYGIAAPGRPDLDAHALGARRRGVGCRPPRWSRTPGTACWATGFSFYVDHGHPGLHARPPRPPTCWSTSWPGTARVAEAAARVSAELGTPVQVSTTPTVRATATATTRTCCCAGRPRGEAVGAPATILVTRACWRRAPVGHGPRLGATRLPAVPRADLLGAPRPGHHPAAWRRRHPRRAARAAAGLAAPPRHRRGRHPLALRDVARGRGARAVSGALEDGALPAARLADPVGAFRPSAATSPSPPRWPSWTA